MVKESKKRIAPEFFKNGLYRFVFLIVTYLGGAIFTILTARMLGPSSFGNYTLALSFSLILIALAEAGFSETLIRFVSMNKNNKAKAYFNYLFKLKIGLLFALSLILAISAGFISKFYNNSQLYFPIIVSCFYLFFYATLQFVSDLLYAFKDVKGYVYKELFFQIFRLALFFGIIYFFSSLSPTMPILVMAISSLLCILFVWYYLKKNYGSFLNSSVAQIDKKRLFKYLKYVSISSFSILLLFYTDILILGKFVPSEYLGFYKTAYSLVMFIFSLLIFTPIIYPVFSTIRKDKIKEVIDKFLFYLFVLSIPMTVGAIALSRYFIVLLFGDSYLPAFIPFIGLSLLIILMPSGELFRVLLNARGETKYPSKIIIIGSIMNIILNVLLIFSFLKFGAIYATFGAAISITITRLYIVFFLFNKSSKMFSIELNKFYVIKPLIASAIMAIFVFFFTNWIYGKANLFLGLVDIIGGIIIYFVAMFLIGGIKKENVVYIYDLAILTIRKILH